MKTTKKLLYFLMVLTLPLFVVSCEKDDSKPNLEEFEPGEIPGLGDTDGELTGATFTLPNGITLIEDITGAGDSDYYWIDLYGSPSRTFTAKDGTQITKSFAENVSYEDQHYFGSGRGYVDLLIPLKNNNSSSTTITFPAGLIIRSVSGNSQNGILIKKVTITIPANSSYYLCLSFYCGNAHKSSAHSSDVYVWGVISNASILMDLCERVKNKKINLEEFSPSSINDYTTYSEQTYKLQAIVWRITDYDGMTEADIAYINSLPNS